MFHIQPAGVSPESAARHLAGEQRHSTRLTQSQGTRREARLLFLTLLAERHQAVHLVGLRDVQLAALRHLGELGALVEGAAEAGLPGRRVVVAAVAQFALKLRPRLRCTAGVQSEEGASCRGGRGASRCPVLTLKMAASSSLRKSCFPACFHGMRNIVLASSSQTRPGYFPLLTCKPNSCCSA